MKFEYKDKGKCPSVNPGQCKSESKCPSALTEDDRKWSTCYGNDVDVSHAGSCERIRGVTSTDCADRHHFLLDGESSRQKQGLIW